jgi:DNA-directed RNA polymerase beta' subunit
LKAVCWNCSHFCGEDAKQCPNCNEKPKQVYNSKNDKQLITPEYVEKIFQKIPISEKKKLGIRCNCADMIVRTLIVPPCCIRPSVKSTLDRTKSCEDDLTTSLGRIMQQNIELKDCVQKGKEILMKWQQLQAEVCKFIGIEPPK